MFSRIWVCIDEFYTTDEGTGLKNPYTVLLTNSMKYSSSAVYSCLMVRVIINNNGIWGMTIKSPKWTSKFIQL